MGKIMKSQITQCLGSYQWLYSVGYLIIVMSEPQPDYDGRDASIIANNVFKQLCDLPEGWHDIRPLARNVGAFLNSDNVAYIAEAVLKQSGFIEHNPENHDVRLTRPGRDNCRVGIEVLPSDLQWLRQKLAQLGL